MSKTRSSRETHLRFICLSVIAIIVLVVTLGVAARNRRITPPKALRLENPSTQQSAATTTAEQRVEVEIVALGPDGFEPSQITRASGLFLLAVDNRAEFERVRLRLNPVVTDAMSNGKPAEVRVQEPSLLDVTVAKERRNLDQFINLPPGNYVLTEAGHPDWVCHITITAQ